MPRRLTPLINGYFYHIYNHGIDHRDTYTNKREYKHFQLAMWFYQPLKIPFKLSQYLILPSDQRINLIKDIDIRDKAVKIHAYCLMANHYHCLIEQLSDNGISKYIGNLQNSYTKYFNAKHKRKGPLFLSSFRAKQVHTQEQYLHISRYIHLNPHTAHIIKDIGHLKTYPYSSCPEYFSQPESHSITTTENLKNCFKATDLHWQFISDQADYQRQLAHLTHLVED